MSHTIKSSSTLVDAQQTASTYSQSFDASNVSGFSAHVVATASTPSADAFLAGESAVETLTFDTKANTTAGDYVVVYDTAGDAWAVAADVTGSDAEPTGAIWVAIPAANKTQADISGSTTAADVAAVFETAFDGLTGFTTVITSDDTAADGTMTMTNVLRGPVTASVVKDATDSGSGSISAATTNAGVASEVDTSTEYITLTAHSFVTGLKGQLTSTGTLPAGLATSTDYFVIKIDANTIQLAASLADAEAGTAINITDQGTDGATHTFTPTTSASNTIKLQESNDNTTWEDITGETLTVNNANVSDMFTVTSAMSQYYRLLYTPSAGQTTFSVYLSQKMTT